MLEFDFNLDLGIFTVVWNYILSTCSRVSVLIGNIFGIFPSWLLTIYGLAVGLLVITGLIRVVSR